MLVHGLISFEFALAGFHYPCIKMQTLYFLYGVHLSLCILFTYTYRQIVLMHQTAEWL
jgi:hypothetical protein